MRLIWILLLGLSSCSTYTTRNSAEKIPLAVRQTPQERASSEAFGPNVGIATEGRQATLAAQAVLKNGGNLIDAAIAASFVIAVERPQSTGIGGGGFLLYRQAKTGKFYAIDFRERAPRRARKDMFLDERGNAVANRSIDGILSVGVPGLVAGLYEIHKKFGSLTWSSLLQPSIELAENGFPVYAHLAHALKTREKVLAQYPASARIFLKDGRPYREGEILVQRDLGKTLRQIARFGKRGFYQGGIAQAIVKESNALHGLIDIEDLENYEVKWRNPVQGRYRSYEIVSMPPPSSGGTHVIEILQMLESDPLRSMGPLSAASIHLEASAMQLAFADRARYMGDPDFVKVPVKSLTSRSYARKQRRRINESRETPSDQIQAGTPAPAESSDTTHFSLMDREGNVISSTQTINGLMGSGVVVPGTGILLNDEMDDFSAKPGASNLFGAIGGEANSVEPAKTPLSSMSPTIVLKDGNPVLSIGAPGGTRIITCVAQTILNYLEFGLPLYDSVAAIRFHHQWMPDQLDIDAPGPDSATLRFLDRMGYQVKVKDGAVPCRVMAVAREGDAFHSVSDPRDIGSSAGL